MYEFTISLSRTRLFSIFVAVFISQTACHRLTPQEQVARYLNNGRTLMQQKKYSAALLEFKNAGKIDARSAEAYYYSALVYLNLDDLRSALLHLQKAIQLNPNYQPAQLKYAELLAKSERPKLETDAHNRINKLLESDPDNPYALTVLAVTEMQTGQPDDAIGHLQQALAHFPENQKAAVELASIELSRKDYGAAEKVLQRATQAKPPSPEALVALARFYWMQNRLNDAKQQLQSALTIDPLNVAALYDLATLQMKTSRVEEADKLYRRISELPEKQYRPIHALFLIQSNHLDAGIAELRKLHEKDPADRDARTRLVAAYMSANRLGQASQLLTTALNGNRTDADALYQQALLLVRKQDFEAAQNNLEELLHSEPNSAKIQFLYARILRARGEEAEARQQLDKALRLNPYLLEARLELASSFTASKAEKEALDILDAAPADQKTIVAYILQRNSTLLSMGGHEAEVRRAVDLALHTAKNSEVLVQDAILKLQSKNYDAARQSATDALQSDPTNLKALELLNTSYVMQKRPDDALNAVRTAAGRQPNDVQFQYYLAQNLMRAKHRDEARKVLLGIQHRSPEFSAASLSLAELAVGDNNTAAARTEFRGVLERDKGNVTALSLLASLEVNSGNGNEAAGLYRRILALDSQNVLALNNLAFLLADSLQQPSAALQYAQKAKELAPNNPTVDDTLGWSYYKNGMYSQSLPYLETASRGIHSAQQQYHLAMAYWKIGNQTASMKLFQTLAAENPDSVETKQAQQLLSGGATTP